MAAQLPVASCVLDYSLDRYRFQARRRAHDTSAQEAWQHGAERNSSLPRPRHLILHCTQNSSILLSTFNFIVQSCTHSKNYGITWMQ